VSGTTEKQNLKYNYSGANTEAGLDDQVP